MMIILSVAMVILLIASTAAQNKTSQYLVVIVTDLQQPIDEWTAAFEQPINFTHMTVNLSHSAIDTLISDFCQNHTNELVIVLDTRLHINKDSLLYISGQLYVPYISVYGFLPPDQRWPKEPSPKLPFELSALSMRASLNDYKDFFLDLIKLFNVSLDTITIIYDNQNKDLLSVFDSYSDQGSTFLLTYEIESVLRENFLQKLQTKMDTRDFVAIGPVSKLELLLKKAKESNMLTEFHRWMIVVTDNKPPVCINCTGNITMVLPVSLDNEPRCNATSLYEVYLYDSILLINNVISQMEITAARFFEHRNICCPISGCTLQDITPTLRFMQEAVKNEFNGCTGMFSLDSTSGHRQITFGLYQLDPNSDGTPDQIGFWNKTSGVVLTEPNSKYTSDWHLRKLRAITVIEPPFVMYENGTYTGYTIQVFTEIAKLNNLNYNITECSDKTYGSLSTNNTWGGCIGQMLRGEADIIVGSLSVTTEREAVVDFTLPYYDFAGIQILFKDDEKDDNLFSFMTVFHWDVWLCLVGVLLTTSILLHVFDRLSPFSGKNQLQNQRVFNMKESMWFVIGSLTQSGGGEPPTSFSSRVLVAGFWFFCIIMMSTFTANLAAFLTVKRITNELTSLDDLAKSKIKYSVMSNTSVMRYFERMKTIENELDKSWKQMNFQEDSNGNQKKSLAVWHYPISEKYVTIWSKIQEYGMVQNTTEAIKRVKNGKFAYITESPIVQWYMSKDCRFTNIGDQFSSRPYAFALKQNSPLVSKFSSSILDLQQKTMLEKYKNEWWKERECDSNVNANKGLDIKRLAGTFIVIGIGLGCGILFLILELIWNKYYFKKKKASDEGLSEMNVSVVFGKSNTSLDNHQNDSNHIYSNPAFAEPKYK